VPGTDHLFRSFVDGQGWLGRFLAEQSYAVYIIHIPLIVFLAYALRDIKLESLLKFGLVLLGFIPLCFLAAFILRKLPLAARIL
jgi:peptidoglycan/LPS O-acetylase OafA/YrhL